MREDTPPEPLLCLLQTLFGIVVGIFACFEFVERSFNGFLHSWAWAALGLLCVRAAWNGVAGLLERPGLPAASMLVAVAVAAGLAVPGPRLSTGYQQGYETRTWELVKDSPDAVVWQNRYTKRVPEPFRHAGWESRYAAAVCNYSLQQKEYSSLGWYGQQAFREHREKYDDQARKKIAETFLAVFQRGMTRIQQQKMGDAATQASFSRILAAVAQKPSVSVLWKLELTSNLPDSVAIDAKDELNSLVFNRLERELNKFFSSHLLRFLPPPEQAGKAKPGDFEALLKVDMKGPTMSWNLSISSTDDKALKPFRFSWSDEKRSAATDPLVPFRISCKAFSGALVDKLGLNAEPERLP